MHTDPDPPSVVLGGLRLVPVLHSRRRGVVRPFHVVEERDVCLDEMAAALHVGWLFRRVGLGLHHLREPLLHTVQTAGYRIADLDTAPAG